MSANKISILTSKVDSFPVLPAVVGRVMEITADTNSSPKDLIKVISPDQSLTATILKMANSAYYGAIREVSTLQHALTILGFAEVRNLVLAKAVFSSFKGLKKTDVFDVRVFWRHSFLCGLAARIIGSGIKGSGNDYFVAGLIHDIGKLVIFMTMPDDFRGIVESTGPLKPNAYEVEKEILGIAHDEVGLSLARKWMFPENLLASVGFHHRPLEASTEPLFPLVVHVADLLAHLSESEENEQDDPGLKQEDLIPQIIGVAGSQGIEWRESDLKGYQEDLAQAREEEAGSFSLFF